MLVCVCVCGLFLIIKQKDFYLTHRHFADESSHIIAAVNEPTIYTFRVQNTLIYVWRLFWKIIWTTTTKPETVGRGRVVQPERLVALPPIQTNPVRIMDRIVSKTFLTVGKSVFWCIDSVVKITAQQNEIKARSSRETLKPHTVIPYNFPGLVHAALLL